MKYKDIKAPTGNKLNCKGWQQEAAYRMLQNNLIHQWQKIIMSSLFMEVLASSKKLGLLL